MKRNHLRCRGKHRSKQFAREDVARLLTERGRGIGVETSNHYLTAMKAFTRWLVGSRRTDTNPLIHLARQNAKVDRRRARRALPEEEFNRFVQTTVTGKTFRGLTGSDRLVLYTLAAQTGLRAAELASLSARSFSLEIRPFSVTVEAGYSKHRKEDRQPLRDDTAQMMKQYIAARPATTERLWPGEWYRAAAEMVRLDLDAAGIPYRDEAGKYFDFHSIRGQFISSLAANGVHPKVAQVLARHSTITLTMDHYTHLDVMDVAGALAKLPAVQVPKNEQAEEQNAA